MNSSEKAGQALSFLQKHSPKEYGKYLEFTKQLASIDALSHKQLELIMVACAVMSQCEMCVALHVEAAASMGASQEEIIQAAFMAVAMGGSPKLMYMSYVYDALEDLFA
ncbi:carboxymuconolactone decarboxylase family protein [Desulfogranum japonicum]|uniref:carboxymuconolactone decarboxylase family protein n=1 Tax=Desulfogranum japonicum TaxID=231447 RepID=UPI0003FEA84F|nr:carboxymuconolactone decarboxylase family protein [Desulfogranum japonicum]